MIHPSSCNRENPILWGPFSRFSFSFKELLPEVHCSSCVLAGFYLRSEKEWKTFDYKSGAQNKTERAQFPAKMTPPSLMDDRVEWVGGALFNDHHQNFRSISRASSNEPFGYFISFLIQGSRDFFWIKRPLHCTTFIQWAMVGIADLPMPGMVLKSNCLIKTWQFHQN